MNAVDPFTSASPTYRAAIRTCERTGPALEVTDAGPSALCVFFVHAVLSLATVALMVGLVLAVCAIVGG